MGWGGRAEAGGEVERRRAKKLPASFREAGWKKPVTHSETLSLVAAETMGGEWRPSAHTGQEEAESI